MEIAGAIVGFVENVEILARQAHATETVIALGHITAQYEECGSGAGGTVNRVGCVVARLATHTVGEVTRRCAVRAVGAAIASRAALAKDTIRTALAVCEIVTEDVGGFVVEGGLKLE